MCLKLINLWGFVNVDRQYSKHLIVIFYPVFTKIKIYKHLKTPKSSKQA